MPLNKQTGNMYPFVTHTWNPIRGKCPHDCVYCYMKGKPIGELRLEEKELKTNLGKGRFIFVGSSTDMFAEEVPYSWIAKVFSHCSLFDNTYLFQTKNPKRFFDLAFPYHSILAITIETNREINISNAPSIHERIEWAKELRTIRPARWPERMISIEPILDFDLQKLVKWMKQINPEFVSIGADSKGHNLPEPMPDKVERLIEELSKFAEVKIKDNLKRLRPDY